MTENLSVLDKAERLRAEARRLNDGAEREADAARVGLRIRELRDKLRELKERMDTARALMAQPGVTPIELVDTGSARAAFSRRSQVGLPENKTFTDARRAVEIANTRLAQENRNTWTQWTVAKLQELPLGRRTMLGAQEQAEAHSLHQELAKITRTTEPNPSTALLFARRHAALAALLATAPEPSEALGVLLERLASARALTLGDFTDEEIALLRESGIASDIEVRRRRT